MGSFLIKTRLRGLLVQRAYNHLTRYQKMSKMDYQNNQPSDMVSEQINSYALWDGEGDYPSTMELRTTELEMNVKDIYKRIEDIEEDLRTSTQNMEAYLDKILAEDWMCNQPLNFEGPQ